MFSFLSTIKIHSSLKSRLHVFKCINIKCAVQISMATQCVVSSQANLIIYLFPSYTGTKSCCRVDRQANKFKSKRRISKGHQEMLYMIQN